MICSYGCGNKAIKQFSNGKYCCSKYYVQCPKVSKKTREGLKKYYNGKGKYFHYSIDEVFTNPSTFSNDYLKHRILESNLLPYVCSNCGISEWFEKLLVLDIHHIDGNTSNNLLTNLAFLCPNCHSLTENYKGKNINTGKKKVSDIELIEAIKTTKNIRQALLKVNLAAKGGNYLRAKKLSAQLETVGVESVKFGETLTDNADGNPELSPVKEKCRDLTADT